MQVDAFVFQRPPEALDEDVVEVAGFRVDDMRRPLAATLMVSIVVFQARDGTFGAVPAGEIEGDEVQVLVEIDPWA